MIEIVKTSQGLAKRLAQVANNIRENIERIFSIEEEDGHLHQIFHEVKYTLLNDLTLEAFFDMYAQTVTHGLFFLRTFQSGEFNLENIPDMIPNTSPFLKYLLMKILTFN